MIDILQSSPVLFASISLALGLLIGSFLNVVIYRLPLMMQRDWRQECRALFPEAIPDDEEKQAPFNLLVPRSACPHCGHRITALENIPLVSYLMLKGQCAGCGTRISLRYPVIELLTGATSCAVAWHFGFGLEAGAAMLLSWALITLTVIDLDHQLLPDAITMPLLWFGLFLSLFHGRVPGDTLFIDPETSLIGALAGYLLLRGVYELFKLATGKEGMGFGDFKLLAALGAWLGWQLLPLIIMLSAVVGALAGLSLMIFRKHGREVPIAYGPYLAAAGWVALIWGEDLLTVYLRNIAI